MTDWPKVWVLFGTYKRTTAAVNTIKSLKKYLHYPNLHFHICDDGSGKTDDGTDRWHVGVLAETFAEFYPEVTYHEMDTPPKKFNTGGNVNRGIRAAQANGCDITMLVFDDWALLRDLDISPHADILDSRNDVGFIRLSYLTPGISGVCMHYDCPRLNAGHIWLRLIRDWSFWNPWHNDSYLVSMQPYIAHRRFFDAYGYFPEGIYPGGCETQMGGQYNNSPLKENGPQILHHVGLSVSHAPWGHMVGRANDYKEIYGI